MPTPEASATPSVSLSPVVSASLVQALATLQSVLSQQLGTTNITTRQGTRNMEQVTITQMKVLFINNLQITLQALVIRPLLLGPSTSLASAC